MSFDFTTTGLYVFERQAGELGAGGEQPANAATGAQRVSRLFDFVGGRPCMTYREVGGGWSDLAMAVYGCRL